MIMKDIKDKVISALLSSYHAMLRSRAIDTLEEQMTSSGEAFFHVSGGGHEGSAILNHFLQPTDWLHCHYRDKALMLARGISVKMFFLATLNKASSHSAGRQMNAHMSDRSLNIMSIVGPVGNNALQAVGVAEASRNQPTRPITLCSMGDGTIQQGEVLEAIAHAVREQLPLLFLIHDNSLAISTKTSGRTFLSTPQGDKDEFYGIPIHRVEGWDGPTVYHFFHKVVSQMRDQPQPQIVRLQVARLSHHTNADDQGVYRSSEEIEVLRKSFDPLVHLRRWLLEQGVTEKELQNSEEHATQEVAKAADLARETADPTATFHAIPPLQSHLQQETTEYLSPTESTENNESYTMLEAIRETLRQRMEKDERIELFGEDIEDPKGDVFGITKGLSTIFPERVINSPLAEASIVGISIGKALAGRRPVAFLQFADFLPIAYNQIFSELGSLYWRTNGSWRAPLIVMITCGAYRPGLGPFHANTFESVAAHTPGIDVMMPAYAGDAAGLLNAAFESERPTLFFYPKSLLNDRSRRTLQNVHQMLIPIGRARRTRSGADLTLIGWGNTIPLCEKTADFLSKEHQISCDVIDLRTIMPWDQNMVLDSARRSGKVIICHEDNSSLGMGAEIAAVISERIPQYINIARVTRPDTFVPCNFDNQLEVLPSYRRLLECAVAMFNGKIIWKSVKDNTGQGYTIDAIGSSPSDESVTVIQWHIKANDTISRGDIIADLEADKASIELHAPLEGTIAKLLVQESESVKVGEPLALLKKQNGKRHWRKATTQENPGIPVVEFEKETLEVANPALRAGEAIRHTVGIIGVAAEPGSQVVTNDLFKEYIPQWSSQDILKRTGIESRRWIGKNENSLSIAARVTKKLMKKVGITFEEIGLIICSTETPIQHTPSMATQLQYIIKGGKSGFLSPAYDINAACSGYLYALQTAFDFLQSEPERVVLLITAEELSTKLDLKDPATAPIFADASSATLLVGEKFRIPFLCELFRPIIGADGEDGSILRVPTNKQEYIQMDGPRVFSRAVKDMVRGLQQACNQALISISDLARIVAHQANQRILNAVVNRLKISSQIMYSNIRHLGNTSSSTIPLCLSKILDNHKSRDYIGLTAFGGGFTFGGAVLRMK